MQLVKDAHVPVAAHSHSGRKRENNEDRFAVRSYRLQDDMIPVTVAVVADGIGGHLAGEVAAQLAVETMLDKFATYNGDDPVPLLEDAVLEAGRVVMNASQEDPARQGMGSTLSAAVVIGEQLYTVSVGDSRIYLLRDGRLRQISVDHTWVQEAIEYEIISPDEAKDHPQAHVLRRYIGGQQLPEPDFRMRLRDGESDRQSHANQGVKMQADDQILLCTDGLTDMVEDMDIFHALRDGNSEQAVKSLLNLALDNGGDDNITLIVMHAPEMGSNTRFNLRQLMVAALLGGFGLIFLIMATVFTAWWLGFWPW